MPEKENGYKRKNDKMVLLNLAGTLIILLVGAYNVLLQKSWDKQFDMLGDQIKEVKQEQKNFYKWYMDCKKDVSDVRQEYQRELSQVMEKIYVWFRNKDKGGIN